MNNKIYKAMLAIIFIILLSTEFSSAVTIEEDTLKFKAYFPSSVKKKEGYIETKNGKIKEISFFSQNEKGEIFIIAVHDYRESKAHKLDDVIDDEVKNQLFRTKKHFEFNRERIKFRGDKCEEIRMKMPTEEGPLYIRNRYLMKNGFLYLIQVFTFDFKRSIGRDQSFFINTFEVLK